MKKKSEPEAVTIPFVKDLASAAFLILLIIVLGTQYHYLSEFHQLPSPLYGGDQYFHYGHVLHIYNGGNPFTSSHYLGEWEHYPWLTHFTIAFMSWIVFTPLSATLLWFPLLATILSGIFSYLLGKKLFTNQWLAVLFSLFWLGQMIPNLGPSMIAQYVMIPILALSWIHWETLRQRILAGVAYGLVGLQHATLFIGTTFFICLRFLYDYGHRFVNFEGNKLRIAKKPLFAEFVYEIRRYLPILLIGIPIALLYWWAPIFVYHGKTLNPWQEFSGQGVSSLTIGLVLSNLYHTVIGFGDWTAVIGTIFALLGVHYTWKHKKWSPSWSFFLIGVLGLVHPFLTQPILGTSFGYYRFSLFLGLPHILFMFYGAEFALEKLKLYKATPYVVLGIILLLALTQTYRVYHSFNQDPWTQTGRVEQSSINAFYAFGSWVTQNTDPDLATTSSHDETAFAYHSLTGRKVVSLRRTHANAYANQNQRIADEAVMLYGKNPATVKELMEKYHIGYLFEDGQSVQNRAACVGLWDNFTAREYLEQAYSCLQTSPEFASYLQENGIEYQKVHVRLDVSEPNAPKYDMLLIKPKDFQNFDMKPIQYVTIGDKPAAALFTVKAK